MPIPATYTTDPASGLQALVDDASVMPDGFWATHVGGFAESAPTAGQADKQVVFKNMGGQPPYPNIAIDFPTVQILIRGSAATGGYSEGYTVALKVRDALLGIPSSPTDYPELVSCRQQGHIQELGRDDRNRPCWSLNLSLILAYESVGYRT